jgi:hypothetical protein
MISPLDIATPLQIVALLLFLFDIGLWVIIYKNKLFKNIRPFLWMQLSYLINIVTFYIVLLVVDIYKLDKLYPTFGEVMMGWSTGIRIHLGLILAFTFIAAIYYKRICQWILLH